ncbi:MAG: sulfotransferase domain-containing protein [Bacteroidales bacterium]
MPQAKKNMVWLASYPKSGNTWFRVFLSNLFSGSPQPVHINNLQETIISSNRIVIDGYLGMDSSELTPEETDSLRPQVFKRFSEEQEGTIYVKTYEAWRRNSLGNPIFPEEVTKGVLYIIRNPLDIAISYSYHNNESIDRTISTLNNDLSRLCEQKDRIFVQTQQAIASWSGHVSSWTEESKLPVHVVRYEDMLDHPLISFKNAIEFLALRYKDSDILMAINNSSFDRLRAMEIKDGFAERGLHSEAFFRMGKSGEWESGLSKSQVNTIIEHQGDSMKRYGYL